MSFSQALFDAIRRTRSCLCVGIDPHLEKLPPLPDREAQVAALEPMWGEDSERAVDAGRALVFGESVVDACEGLVPIVKPQFAFFEALGAPGMLALSRLCRKARAQGLLVLGDGKRGDIASTAMAYAKAQLGKKAPFPCDAATINPFLGPDSLHPWLETADSTGSGLFVLVRTSNPSAATWQEPVSKDIARWLQQESAKRVDASGYSGLGAVVGATWPGAIQEFRALLPNSTLLLPGFGAQGATARDVAPAFDTNGLGALIVGSRSLCFPISGWPDDHIGFIKEQLFRANQAINEVRGA
jgi:orotidine-5'-phosphate decarboxylase